LSLISNTLSPSLSQAEKFKSDALRTFFAHSRSKVSERASELTREAIQPNADKIDKVESVKKLVKEDQVDKVEENQSHKTTPYQQVSVRKAN
jgi:hypothetical protein